jgi:hypothetical protein
MENEDSVVLAETENLIAWRSEDEEVGYVYHLELGSISLHLMSEEWDELITLIKSLRT